MGKGRWSEAIALFNASTRAFVAGDRFASSSSVTASRPPQSVKVPIPSNRTASKQRVMIDARQVKAFGTDGKEIDAKKLARLLAKETPVLVSADGKPIDPFYLRVVKEGTLHAGIL